MFTVRECDVRDMVTTGWLRATGLVDLLAVACCPVDHVSSDQVRSDQIIHRWSLKNNH